MIIATCFALGCIFVVLGLILGSAGAGLRRLGATLIALPIVASIFFETLVSTVGAKGPVWGTITLVLVLAALSIGAYLTIELRRYLTPPARGARRRVLEKKPISPRSASDDVVSFLRERLKSEEPEDRDE